ncbi:Aste57867_5795 [Aphanomyces stellatus]|nr:hypothetical protein As57867_005781 [Aphanomyces stellatus]VFT82818.1 Aste57867_5795 [Aphanomyces stellatus]
MERQKQARRDMTMHVRSLALPSVENELEDLTAAMDGTDMDISTSAAASKSRKKTREDRVKSRRDHFSNQLMHPEWMVDVPSDLNGTKKGGANGEGWYVLPRPDGKRCLVVSSSGTTIARTSSGSILKKFPSSLPCGSRKTNIGQDQYCVLDCIFHEADDTFYVLDVMCWKGYLLYDCTAEFRFYWLHDKLSETTVDKVSAANPCRFQPIPYYECDVQGLQMAYDMTFPFTKDGLLFYCKAGLYTVGLSPLVLLWRDRHTSLYDNSLSLVMRVQDDLACVTLDNIVLHTLAPAFAAHEEITPGDLLRFDVASVQWRARDDSTDVSVQVTGLTFQKRCSAQRGLADSWTKLAHVHQASCSMTQLLLVAAAADDDDTTMTDDDDGAQ